MESVHHQLDSLVKGFLAIKAHWVISKPKQWFFIETRALRSSRQASGSSVGDDTPRGDTMKVAVVPPDRSGNGEDS